MPPRVSSWIAGFASVATFLLGVWAIGGEIEPSQARGSTAVSRILSMREGFVGTGLTIATQRLNLMDCELALRSKVSLETRYLSDGERARIAPICHEVARSVLAGTPASGLAWLVSAVAAADMGTTAEFELGYARSALVAPNEGWLVALRVRAGETYQSLIGPNLQEFEARDLAFAAGNPRYAAPIARRFVSDEAFRVRMTDVLEDMTPDKQRLFLSVVSNVLRAEGR